MAQEQADLYDSTKPLPGQVGAAFVFGRHTLRHTFAKNLVDADTPLDQVATLLGHESLDTTRVYTRPSKRDLEQAVRRAAGEV